MIDFDWNTLAAYAAVATLAGFIDAIAGGGGLITIPALLLGQLSPIQALATNKLQGAFGTLSSTLTQLGKRKINLRELKGAFVMSLIGAALGTILVQTVNQKALDIAIPIVLIAIALYFLLAPKAGEVENHPRMSDTLYSRTIVPIIGFYDGFFGPGTGSFFALAGVSLRGWDLVRATGAAKVMNFASNIASMGVFLWSGQIVWPIGLAMMCGQAIGGYAGSIAAINGGAKFIRPIIVTVCIVMLARYAWQKGYLGV